MRRSLRLVAPPPPESGPARIPPMAWVLQGLLTTLAPIPMLAATLVDAPNTVLGAAGTTSAVAIAITSLSALLLLIGGGVLPDRPGLGRPLSLLGLLVGLGICLPAIAQAPAAALAIFVLVGGIVAVMVSQSAQLIPRWSAQLAPDHPRQKVGAVWAAVERSCATEDFRPRTSALCNYCSFHEFCPEQGGDPSRAAEVAVALGRA